MDRCVVMTVGMTHSGKSTFAKRLDEAVENTVVIDQDEHAAFLNAHYSQLVPEDGPNKIKHRLAKIIVDYAVEETDKHLIICHSNRNRKAREKLRKDFEGEGFSTILVYFNVPISILEKRVAESKRGASVLRTASTFDEVLKRQKEEAPHLMPPLAEEADHFFTIEKEGDEREVIQSIADLLSS